MKIETVIKYFNDISQFFLCAIFIALSFSVSLTEICFGLLLISWAGKRIAQYGFSLPKLFKPTRTDLNIPILVFVAIAFLSTLNSVSIFLSLRGFFTKLLKWILLYFISIEVIDDRKKLNVVLLTMLFLVILLSSNGIFQFIKGIDFIRHKPIFGNRISSSFGNPNSFAGWLVVMIPLIMSCACFLKDGRSLKLMKPCLWLTACLSVNCLFLTYTRGAWLALVLSLIFLGILANRKLLVAAVIIIAIMCFTIPGPIRERASSAFSTVEVDRVSLWKEALSIIEDFPILGCGPNTYATVGPYYKITSATGYYPHNSYLHMAAEIGLIGLGAFIWIIFTLFKISLMNLKKIKDEFYNAVLLGLLAGLFGFLAHSFVDTDIYAVQLSIFMWLIIGLIVAVQKIALQEGALR